MGVCHTTPASPPPPPPPPALDPTDCDDEALARCFSRGLTQICAKDPCGLQLQLRLRVVILEDNLSLVMVTPDLNMAYRLESASPRSPCSLVLGASTRKQRPIVFYGRGIHKVYPDHGRTPVRPSSSWGIATNGESMVELIPELLQVLVVDTSLGLSPTLPAVRQHIFADLLHGYDMTCMEMEFTHREEANAYLFVPVAMYQEYWADTLTRHQPV